MHLSSPSPAPPIPPTTAIAPRTNTHPIHRKPGRPHHMKPTPTGFEMQPRRGQDLFRVIPACGAAGPPLARQACVSRLTPPRPLPVSEPTCLRSPATNAWRPQPASRLSSPTHRVSVSPGLPRPLFCSNRALLSRLPCYARKEPSGDAARRPRRPADFNQIDIRLARGGEKMRRTTRTAPGPATANRMIRKDLPAHPFSRLRFRNLAPPKSAKRTHRPAPLQWTAHRLANHFLRLPLDQGGEEIPETEPKANS